MQNWQHRSCDDDDGSLCCLLNLDPSPLQPSADASAAPRFVRVNYALTQRSRAQNLRCILMSFFSAGFLAAISYTNILLASTFFIIACYVQREWG